jgi:hypothetical protein
MRLSAVVVAAVLAGTVPALAESVVVGDNSHTVGWPVFDQQGHLAFAACDGTVKPMAEGGSFQASDQHCPSRPQAFKLTGKVSAIAPERGRLELKDQSGAVHMLYLPADAAQELAKLQPDATVEVEGPVPGHADKVSGAGS